ncbi:MAG TPA: ATP-binding protein, partial [Dehalococcoidia bacterium]|nr:ATP-binding protein [Dehalococcoidia bacterium]
AGLTRPLDALAKTIALAIETATRNEELRRRQSEEQFRRLADQAQDIIYRYEVRPNPGFTYMSPALTRVVEYTPQDAYADRDFAAKLVHPDDLPTLQAMLKGQLAREPTTFRFFHKRGHLVWVEVLTVPVYSDDGTLLAIEGIARDITARKQMEDQLLRAQRLETAGRIAGQVAHDFNNLLAPLVGYPDLIRAQLPPGHPAAALCADMLEAANHLVAINEELLTLGRRGHFTPEPTDLNRLIDQGLAQLGGRCAGIRVDLRLAPDLLPVRGAPSQLLRVISNLIGNACEAMSEGGTLTVQTENVYLDVPVGRYNRVAIGEYVRLDVADTGVGIAPEVVDRIFDAFFTTKRADNRRGSGLGLSVVQAIVTDHQGYIDVESRLGQGSTFSIYLPVSREPARTEAVQPNLRGGDETILVVDDDAGQRDITRALLLTLGYQVDVVAGGEEAIARLRCHPADLLVLDLIMPPGIDGAETYRRACQVRPGQRAIIVSGHAPSDRVREAQALGAGAYLRKPVTLEKLARAVRAELDRDAGSTG